MTEIILTLPVRRTAPLSCVWIKTGNPTQPLICKWTATGESGGAHAAIKADEPEGHRLCAQSHAYKLSFVWMTQGGFGGRRPRIRGTASIAEPQHLCDESLAPLNYLIRRGFEGGRASDTTPHTLSIREPLAGNSTSGGRIDEDE